MMKKRPNPAGPKTDLRKPLSERAQTILKREFGELPTPQQVKDRAYDVQDAGSLSCFQWLWSLRGCGRQTAEEIARWAGIGIP